jgi:DNA sulfur modification protein DndD
MIRNEYLRFMRTLDSDDVPNNVRKLANIILDHLDEITPLGTAAGRRVKAIVLLAQREFNIACNECAVEIEDIQTNFNGIKRLKLLKVGPFSGFTKPETFDLDSQLVLIYGPNGTGKSSFCEALEYGLLGSVAEAESKRFRDARDYLKNAYVDRFEPPMIEANIADAEPAIVKANESQFRFCFVEKNRIDSFSRIAAHTPARQNELISTLFGLDSFNDFVSGFSTEIDDKYIDIVGEKSVALSEKRQALEGHKHNIVANTQELVQLAKEEQDLAYAYQKDMLFADVVLALGTAEQPGIIQTLETELQQPASVLSDLKQADLVNAEKAVKKAIADFQAKKTELAGHSEDLSYKQLYNAVYELTVVSQDKCPACKTPLTHTTENPFQVAIDGRAKLKHLSVLEQQRDDLKTVQHEAIKSVYATLKKVVQLIGDEIQPNILQSHLVANESSLNVKWWNNLFQVDEQGQSAWLKLQIYVEQLESADAVASKEQAERQQKVERLNSLRELYDKVIKLQARRETLEAGIIKAKTAITKFDENNKELIAAAEREKTVVAQNQSIFNAYSKFVKLLNSYNDALPGKLIADLGEHVVNLYNVFNRSDAPEDLLADLKLPVSSGERIQISFRSAPNDYFDALHVLSEGHIRCVGLAILLAKNLSENCPILIFDDPVNAIDDDHREAIRYTLFEDRYFQDRQIILTCQGEEFFKDIQNLLGAERTQMSKRLTFLPQLGGKQIRIDFHSAPRNYVLAAQGHLEKLETRSALEKARQALETLTKGKIWRYVSKYGDGNLSIKLRTVKAPIELRNLTEQLKKKLSFQEFRHADKDAVLDPITTLLGISGDSREWRYLNKGTHEEADRAEFDRGTVKKIIDSLTALDSVLT